MDFTQFMISIKPIPLLKMLMSNIGIKITNGKKAMVKKHEIREKKVYTKSYGIT